MLAILATDLRYGIGNKPTKECPTGIPWHSSLDFQIYRYLTSGRVKWCSKSTYATLPSHVRARGAYKLLTSNPEQDWEYTFDDVLALPKSDRDARHILIGGLKAYEYLIPKVCDVTVHTTIHTHRKCDFKLQPHTEFKLRPHTLFQYNTVMRVFDWPGTDLQPSQPPISVDIYFNEGQYIPQDFIQFLKTL